MLAWPAKIPETVEESARRVHAWARSVFFWVPDSEEWKRPEHWPLRSELEESAARHGGIVHDDCDGFVSLCRCSLWDLGIQTRIVECNTEFTPPDVLGNHVVLTIEGTGLVLDNRQGEVVSRQRLEKDGYRWIALSSLDPGGLWTEVKP